MISTLPLVDVLLIAGFIVFAAFILRLNWWARQPPNEIDDYCARIDQELDWLEDFEWYMPDELQVRRQLREQARSGNVVPLHGPRTAA